MQTDEVTGHGSHVLLKSDLLVHHHRLCGNVGLVLFIHVEHSVLLDCPDLVSLPLESQVGQVLLAVDPVPDSPLDLEHDRYQNVLDHLTVLHPLGISEDLLYRWVHFGAARLDEFEQRPPPPLKLLHHDRVLQLVYLLIHDHLHVSPLKSSPE